MNRAVPEMLHCLNGPGNGTDTTVLGRQRTCVKLQHQEPRNYFGGSAYVGVFLEPSQAGQVGNFQNLGGGGGGGSMLRDVVTRSVKPDPGLENGWPELGRFELPDVGFGSAMVMNGSRTGFEMNSTITSTSSCPPTEAEVAPEAKGKVSEPVEKMSSAVGSFKKRKADKVMNTKVVAEDDAKDKRSKLCAEEGESKITTDQTNTKNTTIYTDNRETSADTSKENSRPSEVQKPDYIHVRARRGQATDSHSLAERVRREKISERMKYLQDLVPGCNKVTGKAGMLDEIINYVQSLQRQVEFLSMKLATVNPRLDFNIEDLFAKEIFPACSTNIPTIETSSEMTNPAYLQFNPVQEMVAYCGLEMGVNTPDLMALRRTISAPVSLPETYLDTSCFNQLQPPSTWDADLQNLFNLDFHQGRSISFPSQPFTGSLEAGNLKMEI